MHTHTPWPPPRPQVSLVGELLAEQLFDPAQIKAFLEPKTPSSGMRPRPGAGVGAGTTSPAGLQAQQLDAEDRKSVV